jgi:hypothetical protein
MSPYARGLTALLCSAALLGGCKREEPAPDEDRTLARLRQEVDRVNQGGATSGPPQAAESADPNARLAGLAAGHEEDRARRLTPPGANDTVHVDSFAVKLTNLESLHSLRGTGKVSLTTDELFVRAELIVQNVGAKAGQLSLSGAKLVDAGGQEYPIARDAQTLAGTRKLDRAWEKDQRDSLVLLFEVPPAALAPELTLVLPASSGEAARIPLQ